MSSMMMTGLNAGVEQLETDVGSELSVVPLDRDSFGLCERCGTIGLRRNFYARDNNYCSVYCYRSYRSKRRNFRFALLTPSHHLAGFIPMEPLPQLDHPWPGDLHDFMRPSQHKTQLISNSYEWKDDELFGCDFLAAPVKLFKHAPLHDMWDGTLEGMKVEVKNTLGELNKRVSEYYWVATIIKVKGYMGLLRYGAFGSDSSKDFWVNLCCSNVHPVGWCATRGNPLIPPKSIEDKYSDWKKFLVKELTGARTLPIDFYTKLDAGLHSRFSIGTVMEVVDKDRITQVKVASVSEIIGKRLHVKYYDSQPEDEGFWCHEDSPLIHPVGWAFRVGHPLDAPQHYCERVAAGRLLSSDATPNMFFSFGDRGVVSVPLFREGMKLEAIDPLNLSSVCAATVMRVLHDGYMMIRIDVYPADASNSDWFCYHQCSPCIFPVGFSAANNIRLIPPAGYTSANFSWPEYLSQCGADAAGPELFAARSSVEHGFVAGMKLECADLMGPQLVCVATVARVVGNLLKIHFDGWGEEYDQWLWGHSTDMYPVGWCRAVGYRLEGPLQPAPPPRQVARPIRRARKRKVFRNNTAPARDRSRNDSSQSLIEENSQSDNTDIKSLSPATFSPETVKTEYQSADIDDQSAHPEDHSPQAEEHLANTEDHSRHGEDDAAQIENETTHMEDETCQIEDETGQIEDETGQIEDETGQIEDEADQIEDETDQIEDDTGQIEDETGQIEDETGQTEDELAHIEDETRAEYQSTGAVPSVEMSREETEDRMEEEDEREEADLGLDVEIPELPDDHEQDVSEHEVAEAEESKVIPRLVNGASVASDAGPIDPENWTTADVAKFLAVNDCSPYCVNFGHVSGVALLQLSKDDIIELLEMKVGPSLKIFDLIQQLKSKLRPQSRLRFK